MIACPISQSQCEAMRAQYRYRHLAVPHYSTSGMANAAYRLQRVDHHPQRNSIKKRNAVEARVWRHFDPCQVRTDGQHRCPSRAQYSMHRMREIPSRNISDVHQLCPLNISILQIPHLACRINPRLGCEVMRVTKSRRGIYPHHPNPPGQISITCPIWTSPGPRTFKKAPMS